jgi:hypothetical protein
MSQNQMARVDAVREKYEDWLLSLPHVVGVGVGYPVRNGEMLDEVGLIVMVDEKVVEDVLGADDLIPRELDGVPVDVQTMGTFTAG